MDNANQKWTIKTLSWPNTCSQERDTVDHQPNIAFLCIIWASFLAQSVFPSINSHLMMGSTSTNSKHEYFIWSPQERNIILTPLQVEYLKEIAQPPFLNRGGQAGDYFTSRKYMDVLYPH